jgi:hypothetical protein
MVDVGATTKAELRDALVPVLGSNLQQRVASRIWEVDRD